jgi:hypothetical protein
MKCGCEQDSVAQFCRQCGTRLQAVPLPQQPAWASGPNPGYVVHAQQQRVRQNLQPLGIMWCIFGVYRLVTILIAGFVLHTLASDGVFGGMPTFASHMMRAMFPVAMLMTVTMAAAAMLTGYALLTRKPWARILAIVIGILALLKFPFGTALGIYTLWVLAPQVSGAEWDEISRPQV